MNHAQNLLDPKSCLNKALPDEPLFILRGKDKAAPATIRAWVNERIALGMNKISDEQIISALKIAAAMEQWQQSSK